MRRLAHLIWRLVPNRWRDVVQDDFEQVRQRRHQAGLRTNALWAVPAVLNVAIPLILEEFRDSLLYRRDISLQGFSHDCRRALRRLWSAPLYVLAIVSTMAPGLCAGALGAGFLDAVWLRPFSGVTKQEELVRVFLVDPQTGLRVGLSRETVETIQKTFPQVATHRPFIGQVVIDGRVERVGGATISANYFRTLGVEVGAGPVPAAPQETQHSRAVISHRLWSRHFNKAPDIVEKAIVVRGEQTSIAGVAPEGFLGIDESNDSEDIWIIDRGLDSLDPQHQRLYATARHDPSAGRSGDLLQHGGRSFSLRLEPLSRGQAGPGRLISFLALPVLLLVLACMNAANVVFATTRDRMRSWDIEMALGAPASRLLRQKLLEDLILAWCAAGAALVLAQMLTPALALFDALEFELRPPIVVVTFILSTLTPFAFSLLPARALIRGGAERHAVRRNRAPARRYGLALVAIQTAVAVALLMTCFHFLDAARRQPNPMGAGPLAAAKLWSSGGTQDARVWSQVLASATKRTEVVAAGLTCDCLPWEPVTDAGLLRVLLPGRAEEIKVMGVLVEGDLLPILGLRPTGIAPAPAMDNGPIVWVNNAFAIEHFSGHLLNQRVRISRVEDPPWVTTAVGGVLEPVSVVTGPLGATRRNDRRPTIYYSPALFATPSRQLLLQLDRPPGIETLQALRSMLSEVPNLRVVELESSTERHQRMLQPRLMLAWAVGILGAIALVLAAVATFGAVEYRLTRSYGEIAVRVALGARQVGASLSLVRNTMAAAGCGLVAGAFTSACAAAVTASRMYGQSDVSFPALGLAIAVSAPTLSAAVLLPLGRAMRINVVNTLRAE